VHVAADLDTAFDSFKGQVDAVYLADAGLLDGNRTHIVSLALGYCQHGNEQTNGCLCPRGQAKKPRREK
jgi:hypothetical protein